MGTELVGPCVIEDNMDVPPIPPGFESLVPFSLTRLEDNQASLSSTNSCSSKPAVVLLETDIDSNNDCKTSKSLKRRSFSKYGQLDIMSGDESESDQSFLLGHGLPKGVIRGCEECSTCQKVNVKWHPEEGRKPDLLEAPVFYPSEEEFEDSLKYIASIRPKAEMYGICRIVPPPSWEPPCPLKSEILWEKSKFNTRVQQIEKLQNRYSMRKLQQANYNKRKKRRKCMNIEVDCRNNDEVNLSSDVEINELENFGFEPGPEFTMSEFKKYADEFKSMYFQKPANGLDSDGSISMSEEQWQPAVESIEGEYWRMVEKPTENIEVLYGADLETQVFGSGFPTKLCLDGSDSDAEYVNSGWNLNNFPRLPGSVLSFETGDISGVLAPWLYIGMCFSSFCWHVEDHHLYSLNYMHMGDPKLWYGVPGSDALKLESAMRKHLPDLFEEQPDLLHKLVTQLSPSILKSEGVPVYRCVQNPGEFVLTFPRAYHAGFNCGFNCAEAVNVAPVDWLPHGQNAIEIYREQGRKTTISHDKLLLGAAREAVKANWEYNLLRKFSPNNLRWKDVCGKDGLLSKSLKARVEVERCRRDLLNKSSQALKMESSFDANSERECSICLFDLHLSATGCHHCSPGKYACLSHAKQLCSCSWGAKFFLFRYDLAELNLLVEALEGKLSAIYKWARFDLGLSLSSCVSKENTLYTGSNNKSYNYQESTPKERCSTPSMETAKEQTERKNSISTKHTISLNSCQKEKPAEVVLALESIKTSSNASSENAVSKHMKKNNFHPVPSIKIISGHPSRASCLQTSSTKGAYMEEPDEKQLVERIDVLPLNDVKGCKDDKKPFIERSEHQRGNMSYSVFPGEVTPISYSIPTSTSTVARMKHGFISEHMKDEDHKAGETSKDADSPNSPCIKIANTGTESCDKISKKKEISECTEANVSPSFKPQNNNEDDSKKLDSDVDSMLQTVPLNQVVSQHNLDRYYRQKGPRIAKVLRRINCNVELLNIGSLQSGKQWCDSRAIYPKGFRSRVRYIDVANPTNMCYYVSEILDGRDEPLFMVSLEDCPNEVFVHLSASRCWEMVRERVNQEIAKQQKLGREKLPPLQPPGSLDGLDMFGFSSPEIVQAIQAMDQDRVCTDYWKSRPVIQISQQCQSRESSGKLHVTEPLNEIEKSHPAAVRILKGFINKANLEELHTLNNLLHKENSSDVQSLLKLLLTKEIHKVPR